MESRGNGFSSLECDRGSIWTQRAPVYADHHATTPLDPAVFEAMRPWLVGLAGNPSSVHAAGRAARAAVERAREEVGRLLNGEPGGVVFTSGGTEADSLAVRGGARAAREADPARRGVLYSAAEHAAVREAALGLAAEGFEPAEIPVDARGVPRGPAPAGAGTALVSVASREQRDGRGLRRPPGVRRRRPGVGRRRSHGRRPGGRQDPRGRPRARRRPPLALGAQVRRPEGRGRPLDPARESGSSLLAAGGGQERGRRGGTENVAAIVGLGEAARLARGRLAGEGARLAALRDRLEAGLLAAVPGARVNAAEGARLPTAVSVVFPGAPAETLVAALDLEGIAVSAGSACHAGTTAPSRVLLALGLSPADAKATLRISFGHATAETDVGRLLETIPRLVARTRLATRS